MRLRPGCPSPNAVAPASHVATLLGAFWPTPPICDAGIVNVTFDAELWLWDVRRADSWTFVSLPADVSEEIRELGVATPRRGFGSVRVKVTIGDSTWATSIFPDGMRGTYSLPIKQAVRKTQSLTAGDTTTVTIELIDV